MPKETKGLLFFWRETIYTKIPTHLGILCI